MRKIVIYGKGGIGKSTVTSNLSVALSKNGLNVMHIGCDPKADSTSLLIKEKAFLPVLEVIKEKKEAVCLEDIVYEGYHGVKCVECGGPTPGVGCAGRGIITSFELLKNSTPMPFINRILSCMMSWGMWSVAALPCPCGEVMRRRFILSLQGKRCPYLPPEILRWPLIISKLRAMHPLKG